MKVKNKSPWTDGLPPLKDGAPPVFLNDADGGGKQITSVSLDLAENGVKEKGEGILMFNKPVTITDNTEMWSGAKYDIPTLDISQYKGKLTADHRQSIQYLIGDVIGLKKVANRRVTIDGIDLAVKENPLADFVYRMVKAGRITDFSIETMGPWPDEDGVFTNAKLVGLSIVVTGNNKNAHINNTDAEVNQIALQSLEQARENGVDATAFQELLNSPIDNSFQKSDNVDMKFKTILNNRDFAVDVVFKNSANAETTVTLQANQSVEIIDNDANKAVEDQVKNAVAPKKEEPKEVKTDNAAGADIAKIVAESVTAAMASQTAELQKQMKALEQKSFDNAAVEPGFVRTGKAISTNGLSKIADLGARERDRLQIQSALDAFGSRKDESARRTLIEINKYNLETLQADGKVDNAITIGDLGNFIISPELLSKIEGFRSNYDSILNKVSFQDTLSLEMGYLTRSGDIDMQNVEMCEDGEDGNLKPISEYGAAFKSQKLEELAAVTPVCDAATKFLAADILPDIAQGYRTDYDRKRAQLVIARLQQAINETGNVENYNTTSGDSTNPLISIVNSAGRVAEQVENGVWIMSYATYYELLTRRIKAAGNQDQGFDLFTTGENPQLLGNPYIVVPNDLMPKLGSNQTRTFSVKTGDTVGNVTINTGLFFADLSYFSGRTSGGLNYTMSTEAAYEDAQGNVKSAFQRDELLMRGFFYRGGAFRDVNRVAGVKALNFS